MTRCLKPNERTLLSSQSWVLTGSGAPPDTLPVARPQGASRVLSRWPGRTLAQLPQVFQASVSSCGLRGSGSFNTKQGPVPTAARAAACGGPRLRAAGAPSTGVLRKSTGDRRLPTESPQMRGLRLSLDTGCGRRHRRSPEKQDQESIFQRGSSIRENGRSVARLNSTSCREGFFPGGGCSRAKPDVSVWTGCSKTTLKVFIKMENKQFEGKRFPFSSIDVSRC